MTEAIPDEVDLELQSCQFFCSSPFAGGTVWAKKEGRATERR
jgi:hypothetical protein